MKYCFNVTQSAFLLIPTHIYEHSPRNDWGSQSLLPGSGPSRPIHGLLQMWLPATVRTIVCIRLACATLKYSCFKILNTLKNTTI